MVVRVLFVNYVIIFFISQLENGSNALHNDSSRMPYLSGSLGRVVVTKNIHIYMEKSCLCGEHEFKVKITAECMGVKHEATCVCYVKDKAVRYTEWREK